MAEEQKVFVCVNPVAGNQLKAEPGLAASLTPANAQLVIRRAFHSGRIHLTPHVKGRMLERQFDALDVENVVLTGGVIEKPEFCADFGNWRYRMRAAVEDSELEVVIALDPGEDYDSCPLAILVTGYWRSK